MQFQYRELSSSTYSSFNAYIVGSLTGTKLPPDVSSILSSIRSKEDGDGSVFSFSLFDTVTDGKVTKIILMKSNTEGTPTFEQLLDGFARLARLLKREHCVQSALELESFSQVCSAKICIPASVTGLSLSLYSFAHHKTRKSENETQPETLTFLAGSDQKHPIKKHIQESMTYVRAVTTARTLVNEPSSVTTPSYLATVAKSLAKSSKRIYCSVLDRSMMQKRGMGALLAIAQGSQEEPAFIHLSYKGSSDKTVVLVGKGITFDSGGLSLKPSGSMETMKCDMAGAATILGIFSVLDELQPDVNVIGLIAATENMPSGTSIKPGDIVTAMDGTTIEILNTDAEGRVILADALNYFSTLHIRAESCIDIATLTGACVVSLGEDMAGMFCNSDHLADTLMVKARETGEKLWRLPLVDSYDRQLDSAVADIANVSASKYAGAITAALFLRRFVPKGQPWVHLDIAGPAFTEKDAPLTPKGGSGYGVRFLLSYLLSLH